MEFSAAERAFLDKNHGAAMITLRPDGTPHAVRVGVALVDGRLWSSGVPGRARTRYVRRDPRTTVFVFEQGFGYLTIEADTVILEGPQVAEQSLRLFQTMQGLGPEARQLQWNGRPLSNEAFMAAMRAEQRLIYELRPRRTYAFGLPGVV
jgi:hypothetical protein